MHERTSSIEEALLVQPRVLSEETKRKIADVHNSKVGHLGVERTMHTFFYLNVQLKALMPLKLQKFTKTHWHIRIT